MKEDWSSTFTSDTGPFEDNDIEVINTIEEGQPTGLVCIITSKEGFHCRPGDLEAIIARLQEIVDSGK